MSSKVHVVGLTVVLQKVALIVLLVCNDILIFLTQLGLFLIT